MWCRFGWQWRDRRVQWEGRGEAERVAVGLLVRDVAWQLFEVE